MHRPGIYAIVHVLSGRRYIGQTNSFERRWEQHRESLIAGRHHNLRLQEAWNSDSELAFKFVELEVAPAHLQPAQLQRWLLKREHELIRTYKAKGLAFNIVDAELVETRAASEAAKLPQVSASAVTYTELQTVKSQISAAEATIRSANKSLAEASSQLFLAKSQQAKSVGFLRGLFGRTDRPQDIENAKQVEMATAAVAKATNDLAKFKTDLETLLVQRKALYNSYPGNARRAAVRSRGWSMF